MFFKVLKRKETKNEKISAVKQKKWET